jgi:hypothetical protein
MSERRPTTIEVAAGYTALWLAGDYRAAGETCCTEDVVSIEPRARADGTASVCRGIDAVRARLRRSARFTGSVALLTPLLYFCSSSPNSGKGARHAIP